MVVDKASLTSKSGKTSKSGSKSNLLKTSQSNLGPSVSSKLNLSNVEPETQPIADPIAPTVTFEVEVNSGLEPENVLDLEPKTEELNGEVLVDIVGVLVN